MVSVCLPSDALLQHLSSYLGFSYLGRGVSLHGCSSKLQPLLLTLDEGYLLTTALPDLQHGIAPLGPPAPSQDVGLVLPATAPGLGCGVAPPTRRPWPRVWGRGVAPPARCPCPLAWGMGYLLPVPPLLLHCCSLALSATTSVLRCSVAPLGHRPSSMGSSRLLPLTSDMG